MTCDDGVAGYGRQYAVLCAASAPWSDDFPSDDLAYTVLGTIGPHFTGNEAIRNWIHWARTDNHRSLYDPQKGYRRQAEWDDHGEAYPYTFDGPDLRIKFHVLAGAHQVSLYFFNKDGHDGENRHRDFLVELLKASATQDIRTDTSVDSMATKDIDQDQLPQSAISRNIALAQARVRHFWGGMYCRFVVQLPGNYQISVKRCGSLDTICSGIFIDRLCPERSAFSEFPMIAMGNVLYRSPSNYQNGMSAEVTPVFRMWQELRKTSSIDPRTAGTSRLLYRIAATCSHSQNITEFLCDLRWHTQLWSSRDREVFNDAMQRAWKDYARLNQ